MLQKVFSAMFVWALLFGGAPAQAALVYDYVGQWYVGDGPAWNTRPEVLNAQETAALLFGGSAADYAISTISDQPEDINFMAFVDGFNDSQYLTTPVAQDFSLDLGDAGFGFTPRLGADYSAFVLRHSCNNRIGHPEQACLNNPIGLNYAFRLSDVLPAQALAVPVRVPEPATLALFGFGLAGMGIAARRIAKKV
ncbi:MAG: PEP-CTERM sorting domain-containing protein [Magnetospiraceae bacterium]